MFSGWTNYRCSWQRVLNPHPPYFFLTLLYIALPTPLPLFFKFCPTPLSNLHPHWSFRCHVSLADWIIVPRCVILRNHIMDQHMSSLGIIVPKGPCCVFYATRHQVYWSLPHCGLFTSILIWYHTKTHRTEQELIDWHTCVNIYKYHLLCARSSCLYYNEWIICWYFFT